MIIGSLFLELQRVTIPSLSKFSKFCKGTTEMAGTIIANPNPNLLIVMDPAQNYN